jgi:hypothetical protein
MAQYGRGSKAVDVASRSVHLQGIGRVPAVRADELQPGMLLSWNWAPAGYKIIAVRSISAHYVEVTEASRETGEVHRRRIKKDVMVAASWPRERDRRRQPRRSKRSTSRVRSRRRYS